MRTHPSGSTLNPSEALGPYRLGEMLGKGGMGRVYRAFDRRLDRWVAAKCLHHEATDQDRRRFRREARTLARLGHPAIVQIFDIVEDGDTLWIVMELIDGPTLSSLRRRGPIEPKVVIDYARQIVSALEAAHSHGIIHRDLKSENVMILPSGHVKVLDFGLAFQVASGSQDRTWNGDELAKVLDPALTEPGRLLGTPRSMAPEQILELELDARSDLFSLGVLLYEILSGHAPFVGGSVPDVLRRVVYDRLPPIHELIPAVPQKFSDLIDRLMRKDPFDRPQTAAAVAEELTTVSTPDVTAERQVVVQDEQPTHRGFLSEDTPYRSLGERRQVTVLCCDLAEPTVGTINGSKPDLEVLTEHLPVFLDTAKRVVEGYQGTPGALSGSRLMAYFGYPAAYEDGAVRAVHAALDLIGSWRVHSPGPERLALRIGIHSGPAVIAPGESRDPLMLGSTFDHTVEVQRLATLDAVVVSAATRHLVWRSFDLDAIDDDVEGWRVTAPHHPQADSPTIEVLPMVSRAHELELLLGRWRSSEAGRGQVILISGEAGIGKSCLIRAFRSNLPDRTTRWWIAHGSPFLRDSPFAPIAEMLGHEVLQTHRDDGFDAQLDRLEAFLERFDLPRDEVAVLLAALLEVPTGDRYAPLELAPDARRQQTLAALVALFAEMADERPWVLAIEDLHWMDPSTLELLGQVVDGAASTSLCVLATCRPDGLPSWQNDAALTRIHLDQLTDTDGGMLVDQVAAGHALDPALREQILARADGIPLFIEELTKTILEAERDAETATIPSTLRDSLTARLDRLGSAKPVAETAATIGRTFTLDLLAAIDARDETTLRRELDRLSDAGLIYRKGFGSRERYLFKHALIRDIAYDALLRKDRQALHRRIADVLIEQFTSVRDTQPEIVAHHFTEAGDAEAAVPYWRRAGQAALAGSAHLEAIHHLERALHLLDSLPDRTAMRAEELTVLGGLGTAMILDVGFTAPEVEAVWQRAYTVCEEAGRVPSFDVLWGLYAFRSVRGEWWLTGAITDQMLQFASESEMPMLRLQSRYLAGVRLVFTGQPEAALVELDRAATFDSPELGQALILNFAQDSRVMVHNYRAVALWLSGATDEAFDASRRAQEMASETGHPFTVSTTLLLACVLDLLRRDGAGAEAKAEALIETARDHGLYQDRDGRVLLGCARILRIADGTSPVTAARELAADLGESLATLVDSGSRVWSPFYTAHRAEALLLAGDLDAADELLAQAGSEIDTHGECFWQAEISRLRGAVARARGETDAAREHLTDAESVAREQKARALASRARTALDRLDASI